MFRTVSLSIIRSLALYTQQQVYVIQVMLTAVSITCMTYTMAVYIELDSWWRIENLSETCRVLFQKQIREISASRWFYYKNISRCTVLWMSNNWVCSTSLPWHPCCIIDLFTQKYIFELFAFTVVFTNWLLEIQRTKKTTWCVLPPQLRS